MNNINTLRLLRRHMDANGLQDWSSRLDGATKRFGVCWRTRKRITISRKMSEINDCQTVLQTILHEIAHALAPLYEHHGNTWKGICISIGASPERCYDSQKVVAVPSRYTGTCPLCQNTFQRTKRPTRKNYCRCDKRRWLHPICWVDNKTGQKYHTMEEHKKDINYKEKIVSDFDFTKF